MPLPIIMYHEVKPDKSGKDAIQPWELESDLRWLAENGYTTVVMADVICLCARRYAAAGKAHRAQL